MVIGWSHLTNNKIVFLEFMKKLVIVGCGYLANIVSDALLTGLLPEYNLVGVYSRTKEKAHFISEKMKSAGRECLVAESLEELLALKPDIMVESATPAFMKEIAVATLENGTSIVTLSIGALADSSLLERVKKAASENGSRIYISSGATGGFDVLRTATLMGNASAGFLNVKGVRAFRGSSLYSNSMETDNQTVFSGTAREAIETFPTGLNVAVAASLATVGADNLQVTMESTPDFTGDRQRVEIKNDEVHAVVDVYSATSAIAGWSVVSTLQNIVSPIVF